MFRYVCCPFVWLLLLATIAGVPSVAKLVRDIPVSAAAANVDLAVADVIAAISVP